MDIVKAQEKDLEELFNLHNETSVLHEKELKDYLGKLSKKEELNYLKDSLKDEKKVVYVARSEDGFLGYIICGYFERWPIFKNRKVGFIESIGVKKEYRKKGVASQLLEQAVAWFKEQGYAEIDLNVFSFNEDAIKFYEKHNFSSLNKTMTKKLND